MHREQNLTLNVMFVAICAILNLLSNISIVATRTCRVQVHGNLWPCLFLDTLIGGDVHRYNFGEARRRSERHRENTRASLKDTKKKRGGGESGADNIVKMGLGEAKGGWRRESEALVARRTTYLPYLQVLSFAF